MADYEIIKRKSSFDKKKERMKKRKKKAKNFLKKFQSKKIFYGVVILILILGGIAVVEYFFMSDFYGDENIKIVGEFENFSKEISGDVSFEVEDYIVRSEKNTFKGKNTEFVLTNFSGTIKRENGDTIVYGKVSKVVFDGNEIDSNYETVTITSSKKSQFLFENTSFYDYTVLSGKIQFDKDTSSKLENSKISLENFKGKVVLDDKITFLGHVEKSHIHIPDKKIKVSYG